MYCCFWSLAHSREKMFQAGFEECSEIATKYPRCMSPVWHTPFSLGEDMGEFL